VKMRRCEDEKMFYRPPLLEEPCAQTLSGKNAKKLDKEEAVEQLGQVLGVGVNNWQPAKDLRSKGKVHQFSAHSQPKNPKKPQVSIG